MSTLIRNIQNRQIHSDRKQIRNIKELGGEELLLNGQRISVWCDVKFWKQWKWLYNTVYIIKETKGKKCLKCILETQ